MSEETITYDVLNFDGLERRGNYRLIAYREDMLHTLNKKDSAAIIYHIIYRWQTEYKRPAAIKKIEERKKSGQKPYTAEEVEDMMFVYMSYNDFVRESGGALGYNTVKRTLAYLVNEKKALIQRANRNPKYSDFEYSVNKDTVRTMLKELPVDPAFTPKVPKIKNDSTQMGIPDTEELDSTQMGTLSTQTGIGSTQMGTEVYPNGGTSQNLTETTDTNTDKESTAHSDEYATPSLLSDADLLAELQRRGLSLPAPTQQEQENDGSTHLPDGHTLRDSDRGRATPRTQEPLAHASPEQHADTASSDALQTAQDVNTPVDNHAANVDNSRGKDTHADSVPDTVAVQSDAPDPGGHTDTPESVAQDVGNDRIASEATRKEANKKVPQSSTPTPKKARYQLTLQGQHIIELHQQFRGRRLTLNDDNVKAANGLGDVVESDADFQAVLQKIKDDPFLKERKVRTDLDFVFRKYDGFLDQVDADRRLAQQRAEAERKRKEWEEQQRQGNVTPLPAPPRKLSALEQHNRDLEQAFKDSSTGPRPPLRMLATSR